MTQEEELEQLRQENTALRAAGRSLDEKLAQWQQAKKDLGEGLKEAIIAIGHQQERIKPLEGLIPSQQERIKPLEGQLAKDSHKSSLPPTSDRFVRPPKSEARKRVARKQADRRAIVGIISSKWSNQIRSSFMPLNAVSPASTTCVSKPASEQSGAK
jgi:chromosome segregation ATPase